MSQNQKENNKKITHKDSITNDHKNKLQNDLKEKDDQINKLNLKLEELKKESN